jgi:prolyl-tRNA synthetase
VFDMQFLDGDGQQQLCWTTSWGTSTRMVGGLIMGHGDDRGLVVPPRLAPIQCVVLLVKDENGAGDTAFRLADELNKAGVRVQVDNRVDTSFGRRATDWELKGVPLRLEVGPRDLANSSATLVRRDTATKETVRLDKVVRAVSDGIDVVQAELLAAATTRRDDRTVDCSTLDDIVDAAQAGFARAPWSVVGVDGEKQLAESAVSVRCLQRADGSVPDSEDEPDLVAYCARAY